jgi:hypothetical protein
MIFKLRPISAEQGPRSTGERLSFPMPEGRGMPAISLISLTSFGKRPATSIAPLRAKRKQGQAFRGRDDASEPTFIEVQLSLTVWH